MNAFRLEIINHVNETRSTNLLKKLKNKGFSISDIKITNVYTVDKEFSNFSKEKIALMLTNKIFEQYSIDKPIITCNFDYAFEIGFLPGVTDNIGKTVIESIEDLEKTTFDIPHESVYSSNVYYLRGDLQKEVVQKIAKTMLNPLIQSIKIKSKQEFIKDQGMGIVVPKVKLEKEPTIENINLMISEQELKKIGKEGIVNKNGISKGPLALRPSYMKVIQEYFKKQGRDATDVEIEAIAQTWSEHCKHTIFADPLDDIKEGIYKHYIKKATNEIRAKKGDKDFCVSVFTDNAGGIIFDDNYIISDKAETHNSPSALDPFGGAVTGIVGVNRDALGFGKGSKPVINRYGYCTGNPQDKELIYRDKDLTDEALSPRAILDGVVAGVNAGGNQSGIPAPQGFVYFEDRYKGKPLVFVGTIGLIPRKINGENGWEKKANKGDKIVIAGGRVGLDGIHGATFSSEALTSGSPVTAVQIGDPITQKKMSDAIIKEIRDLGLYNSITDNGAGGISCSIAEMARESGGCNVDLEKNLLKYPNLDPWEIWISESQERMTFAVPPENVEKLQEILKKHDVESYVVGEFTDSGRCIVNYNGNKVMDLDMEFLHNGLPKEEQYSVYTKPKHQEPEFKCPENLNDTVLSMISRNNIASFEFITIQYDHEVQAGSVIKPLHGNGRVNGPATVTRPVLNSKRGVVASQGITPRYSDIDTYHMAACSIDTAIRNAVSVGGNIDYLAIMDNFCWCSSDEPGRLGELKEAAKACYEIASAYGTPFISGKDSMFNDFKGYDRKGNPIKISIPPTLLVSSVGVIEDTTKCISIDPKFTGDLVYVIGETLNELGGSEYFHMKGFIGNNVPKVEPKKAYEVYKKMYQAINKELIASATSIEIGGIGVSLTKMAISGKLGMNINLKNLESDLKRDDYILFSESQSRLVVTVDPKKKEKFEDLFPDAKLVGEITNTKSLIINGVNDNEIVNLSISKLEENYKKPFKNY
jgi:phosphoribosylformylglycinamidine synthase subunit PurSL